MRCLILAAVCVVAGGPASAQPVDLGDEGLKQTVTGKTVHLDTPFGVAIPITYHGNGLMSGKAGVLEYFLGAQADRGRWWVANGKLCQKWFKWLDAEPSCMQLKQDGNKILWRRDDGLSGTATIASGLPVGTDAAPRGLGGPVPSPKLGQSLVATERPETMATASAVAFPAEVHRAPKPTPPRPAPVTARSALHSPAGGMGAEPRPPAAHEPLPAARELASSLIRVMAIAPGIFETPMMAGLPEDARASLGAQVPHPSRLGRPQEYAKLAPPLWLTAATRPCAPPSDQRSSCHIPATSFGLVGLTASHGSTSAFS